MILNGSAKRFSPAGEEASLPAYTDIFQSIRTPETAKLIREFKRCVYACASINANAVTSTPLRLYVISDRGEKATRWPTRKVSTKRIDYLCETTTIGRKQFQNVEEIISHPCLRLLDYVNSFPGSTRFRLFRSTQLSLDILGSAYWWKNADKVLGTIKSLWFLPAQYMTAVRKPGSSNIIDYYEFGVGLEKKTFPVDEIIPFHCESLHDPYRAGVSPAMAAYEDILVSNKLVGHENSMLSNQARPDLLLLPEKDEPIGTEEADQFYDEYNKRFRGEGQGRVYVSTNALKVFPLNYPPRDLGRLEIDKRTKVAICNTFDVPVAFVESQEINRAVLEGSLILHARNSTKPRCGRIQDILNENYISEFDDSGRLYLAYDDPVPEDKAAYTQETVSLVQAGVMTPNEGRARHDLPPSDDPNADKLHFINEGSQDREQARANSTADK